MDRPSFTFKVLLFDLLVDVVDEVVEVVRTLFCFPLLVPQEDCVDLTSFLSGQKSRCFLSSPLDVLTCRDSTAFVLATINPALNLRADLSPYNQRAKLSRHHHFGKKPGTEDFKVNLEAEISALDAHSWLSICNQAFENTSSIVS